MGYIENLEKLNSEMIEELANSVRINSAMSDAVRTPDGEVYPFGKGVQDALVHFLELGKRMGFEVHNYDNYAGEIVFPGDPGDETFGIIGHLDVVPAADDWMYGPFNPVIEDGYMYGRGTSDDKGPVMAGLFAIKAIRDAGITPKKNIKIIVGLDEEHGTESVEHYRDVASLPDFGITPDANFPVINGEKGILSFDIAQKLKKYTPKEGLVISKLQGGLAANAVPAQARAVLASEDRTKYDEISERVKRYAEESGYDISAKKTGTSLAVEAHGLAAHGSIPEKGLNAVSILMEFLGKLKFAGDDVTEFIDFYNDHIGFDLNGERLGCKLADDKSGKLIVNVGTMEINDEVATMEINIRIPVTFDSTEVYAGIESVLGANQGIVKVMDEKSIYIDPEVDFVKTLMAAYKEYSGDKDSEPIVIGGGTYAKHFNRVLAFGALFPWEEDRMHMTDERISLDSYSRMANIFAATVYNLCCR